MSYSQYNNAAPLGNGYNYQNNSKSTYIQKQNNAYGNNMSKSAISNKTNNDLITIDQALSQSNYPPYCKDFIREYIKENYSDNPGTKVYFPIIDKRKIFVIEYIIPIFLSNRKYNVNVLVYLHELFPNYEPEFYILKNGPIGINDHYKEIINIKTFQINIDKICKFKPELKNIQEIVDALKSEFQKNFPIYRIKTGEFEYVDKANFNKQEMKLVKIINDKFDDKTFMDFIRNQTKDKIREKYEKINSKYKYIENNNQILNNLKNEMKQKLNLTSNQEVEKLRQEKEKLIKIKNQLKDAENYLNQEVNEIENKSNIPFEKCNEFILIKDPKDMEYLVMKKTLEDYLAFLRKGYEKRVISFEEMIENTRMLSREMFYIDYLRNKKKNC